MLYLKKLFFVVLAALALASCGGGAGAPNAVVANNTTFALNASAGPAFVEGATGSTFSFPASVPALGTTGPTTIKIISAGANPTVEITDDLNVLTGNLRWGSCIFRITAVVPRFRAPAQVAQVAQVTERPAAVRPVPPGTRLQIDDEVEIQDCNITASTKGVVVGGSTNAMSWVIGGSGSTTTTVNGLTFTINGQGQVFFNGNNVGQVTLVTGTTS